jgi:hypothetical protein
VEEYAFPGKIEEGTRYRRINGKDPRAPNRQLIFVSELSIPILFAARFVGHFVSTVILALIVFSAGRAKIAD